jgi:hypothetical protein
MVTIRLDRQEVHHLGAAIRLTLISLDHYLTGLDSRSSTETLDDAEDHEQVRKSLTEILARLSDDQNTRTVS